MRGAQPHLIQFLGRGRHRSPHARGSTEGDALMNRNDNPIPACAGLNRTAALQENSYGPDPRMRGAQPPPDGEPIVTPARSPHARGSTARIRALEEKEVPIPACAGLNRARNCRVSWGIPDPRMRGAQPALPAPGRHAMSRSPHARGSTVDPDFAGSGEAPIPACAGLNRPLERLQFRAVADPRMRGAQPHLIQFLGRGRHRSPHARGSTEGDALMNRNDNPIPACAGLNRTAALQENSYGPDPRMRGAQPPPDGEPIVTPARSPHARGSTARIRALEEKEVPIPACAGLNRARNCRVSWGIPDPRMRGAQPR